MVRQASDMGQKSSLFLLGLACSTGMMLTGFDIGVIAGALLFIVPEFELEGHPKLVGALVAASLVGAFVGTLISGPISDFLGRRRLLRGSGVLFLLSACAMGWAPGIYELVGARLLTGLAIGFASTIVPVYIAECAPAASRGMLNTLPQVAVSTGILISYLADFGIAASSLPLWRIMLGLSGIPALLFLLLLYTVPESPRWLATRGQVDDAHKVLQDLRGEGVDITAELDAMLLDRHCYHGRSELEQGLLEDPALVAEKPLCLTSPATPPDLEPLPDGALNKLAEEVWPSTGRRVPGGWAEPTALQTVPWSVLWRPLALGMGLKLLQECSGINAILYYTPIVFKDSGAAAIFGGGSLEPRAAALLATACSYSLKIPAALLAMRLLDSAGRRMMLLASLPVNVIALMALALSSALLEKGFLRGVISMISTSAFVGAFAMGLGPVPLIVVSEIFPTRVRGACLSVCFAMHWVSNVIITEAFPSMRVVLGLPISFSIFAAFCTVTWIFAYLFMPETKGLSLEEVTSKFRRHTL